MDRNGYLAQSYTLYIKNKYKNNCQSLRIVHEKQISYWLMITEVVRYVLCELYTVCILITLNKNGNRVM